MKRRLFLERIAALMGTGTVAIPAAALPSRRIELQRSPLAGYQYHDGERLWPLLAVGARLDLAREPENAHDKRAVRVEWNGHKLGYLPRLDNAAASHLLDNGQALHAEIVALRVSDNPWQRVELAVTLLD